MQLSQLTGDHNKDTLAFIQDYHHTLVNAFPGLQLRWVRIYGKRWDHMYGDAGAFSGQALRIKLNTNYGLCLDNPELIPTPELETIIAMLREIFNDDNLD